jgi:ABC-type nickel/cobalt efflux system permease component RcnA
MNDLEIAIGWTLIHSLWQAGIAAILLAALLGIVRSSNVRYVLACGTLLAIVAAFITTFAYFAPQRQEAGSRFAVRMAPDPREFAAPSQTGASPMRLDLQRRSPGSLRCG